jgi:hypothetical protein
MKKNETALLLWEEGAQVIAKYIIKMAARLLVTTNAVFLIISCGQIEETRDDSSSAVHMANRE